MQIIIQSNRLTFVGQVKDIIFLFSGYSGDITLAEFLRMNLM